MRGKSIRGRDFSLQLLVGVILFLGTLCWSALASADWVRRYYGPTFAGDSACAIAVDSSGNVYVTGDSEGASSTDYATIKYDTNGNQKWVRRYNGPLRYTDHVHDIAVDGSGNVYVTGQAYGNLGINYATIKYDTDGNQKWVRQHTGPVSWDRANAIAVDAQGNVYLAGYLFGDSSLEDFITIKYDTDGNRKWVKRYNGPDSWGEWANAIAVDKQSNVYVAGNSAGYDVDEYLTIKYDTNGNQKWVRRYHGPGDRGATASAMAVDGSGNVYVTGHLRVSSGSDYATIKYDADGNQKWVRRYNGPGNWADEANAVAVDTRGNVYVAGYSYGGASDSDYATIKYDADGNQKWVRRYNGPGNGSDEVFAMAVDGSGNVSVTGWSDGGASKQDYCTVQYDTNGKRKWVKRYSGPGNGHDRANAIGVDAGGNVYVTGSAMDGAKNIPYYVTIKYAAD
jgi:uncharacterized delta-60 repeat protein